MNNINPTKTISWRKLYNNFLSLKNISIKNLFENDKNRFKNFSLTFNNSILFDFSKNFLNRNTINLLIDLAKECKLDISINQLFSGNLLDKVEKKSILYPILRCLDFNELNYKNEYLYNETIKILEKLEIFYNKLNNDWLGYTNKPIKNIVNIGTGSLNLYPKIIIDMLEEYKKNNFNIYFVSSIDGIELINLLKKIDSSITLFIIISENFDTLEVLENAKNAKKWFLNKAKLEKYLDKHFIIISSNEDSCKLFGISNNNLFKIIKCVNRRFSVWSSVGLSIILSIGFENFKNFLYGAFLMDKHFRYSKLENNIPVIMSLISIWYNNFFNFETESIITCNYYMSKFINYYQQLSMESNGKSLDRNDNYVNYNTGAISFGGIGINNENSIFQFMNQGTKTIPSDFILVSKKSFINNDYDFSNYDYSVSSCLTQSMLLSFGFKNNDSFKECLGNKPNNVFLLKKLNPCILGSLISMYEHKIFVQGVIFNISSFNQPSLEINKLIFENINLFIKENKNIDNFDSSTNSLIEMYKYWKNN